MKPVTFLPFGGSEYTFPTIYNWSWVANSTSENRYFSTPGIHGDYPLSGRVLSRRRTGTLKFTLNLGRSTLYDSYIDAVLTNFKYAGYLKVEMTNGTYRNIYFAPETINIDYTRRRYGLVDVVISGHAGAYYQGTGLTASKNATTPYSLNAIDTGNVDVTMGLSIGLTPGTNLTAFTISNTTNGTYFSYAAPPNINAAQTIIINVTAGTAMYSGSTNVRHRVTVPATQIPLLKLTGGVTNSITLTTTPSSVSAEILLSWAQLWL